MSRFIPLFLLVCAVVRADIDAAYGNLKRRAADRAPEVVAAQAAVDEKHAASRGAWAHWLPQADLQLSQNYSKDFSFLSSGVLPPGLVIGDPRQANLSAWSIQVAVPLYRRSVHLGIEQGSRESAAAEAELRTKLSELDWKLRESVGRFLSEAFKVEALETNLKIAQQSLRETEMRFQLGSRTKIDLLRAEANVVSLDSKRLSFSQTREAGRNSVLETSGLTDAEFRETGFDQGLKGEGALALAVDKFSESAAVLGKVEPYLQEPSVEKLQARVTSVSPQAALIALQREAAENRAALLVAPHWPELTAQGRLFKQGPSWTDAFASGQTSYAFGLVLKIPLSLGGGAVWALQEKSAVERTAEVERARGLRSLWSAVESERLQVQALQKSVASFSLNVRQNEELVRLSTKSYELGKTTLVDYLGAQNDLLDAKINLTKAKIDLSVLVRRLASHLGVAE